MPNNTFWIFVEGDDDARFFQFIKPGLEMQYGSVRIWKYAQKNSRTIRRFLQSISHMGSDYIYVTDINDDPCITAKKQKKQKKINLLNDDKIVVVVREVESWYLAGLDKPVCNNLRIPHVRDTNSINKQQFDSCVPNRFVSRTDFMVEVLKNFSIQTAKRKNESFSYFARKHGL